MSEVEVSGSVTNTQPIEIDEKLTEDNGTVLRIEDYYTLIANEHIHEKDAAIGRNDSLGTGPFQILSNPTVNQPANEMQMEIVSTSVNDTAIGTGAQQVTLEFFNKEWEWATETITLNGTTVVNTVATDIYRIDKMYTNKGNIAAGTITLKDTGAVALYGQINQYQTFMERAIHYVKKGYTCVVTDIVLGCTTNGGVIWRLFRSMEDPDGNIVTRGRMSIETADSTIAHPYNIPVSLHNPNGKRMAVGLAATARNANQQATCSLRYYDKLIS